MTDAPIPRPTSVQRNGSRAFSAWLAVLVLKRVSSLTLTLEKAEACAPSHRT